MLRKFDTLVQTVHTPTMDIEMVFGIKKKCGVLQQKRGRIDKMERISLLERKVMEAMDENG